MTPEEDVATHIATLIGPLVLGSSVFVGPIRPPSNIIPHQSVFVIGTGGFPDNAYMDGGQKRAIKFPTVQIMIRSNRSDYDGGLALAHQIYEAIDKEPPAGYTELRTFSQPTFVRQDDQEHYVWSINATLTRCS